MLRGFGSGGLVVSGHLQTARMGGVDVLSSRILLRPADLGRSLRFYRDVLGLAIYRESGLRIIPGWCSFSARGCWRCPGTPLAPLSAR